MSDHVDLSVIVPAFNEEACLQPVLRTIRDVLAASDIPRWEIVVVDDGSSDATYTVATAFADEDTRIRALRHARNRGQGAALATGFSAAAGEWITWLPADGQIAPAELVHIWAATPQADFITTHYRQRDDGLVRAVLSAGLSTLIWLMLGVWAFGGGVYGFRRTLWQRHRPETDTMLIGVEFRHKLRREPVRYRDVEIDCAPRLAGTSKSANLRTIGTTFAELWRIRARAAGPRKRRWLWFVLKLVVTVGLLIWMFSKVDVAGLGQRLASMDRGWLVLALLLGATNITLGAIRWGLVLIALGTKIPWRVVLYLFWSALFFNTYLPTGVVGDALRGTWTARAADATRGFLSVILDRVAALFALALVAAWGLTLPSAQGLAAGPAIGWICAAILLPGLFVVAFPHAIAGLGLRLGGARLRRLCAGKRVTTPPLGLRVAIVVLAALLHLITILMVACLAQAADLTIALGVLVAVVPAVMVIAYLPISISGIGVRDAAMVELFGQVGVAAEGALAVSLAFLAVTLLVSGIGGLVHLVGGRAV